MKQGKEALGGAGSPHSWGVLCGTARAVTQPWWHGAAVGLRGPVGQRCTVMLRGCAQTSISLHICSRAPLVAFVLI